MKVPGGAGRERDRGRERLPGQQREVRKCERSSNRKEEEEGEEYGPERRVRGGENLGRWRLETGRRRQTEKDKMGGGGAQGRGFTER